MIKFPYPSKVDASKKEELRRLKSMKKLMYWG
jgi:hypothetical protein